MKMRFTSIDRRYAGLVIRKRFLFGAALVIYLAGIALYALYSYDVARIDAERRTGLMLERAAREAFSAAGYYQSLALGGVVRDPQRVQSALRSILDREKVTFVICAAVAEGRVTDHLTSSVLGVVNGANDIHAPIIEAARRHAVSGREPELRTIEIDAGTMLVYFFPVRGVDAQYYFIAGADYARMNSGLSAEFERNARMGAFFLLLILPFVILFIYFSNRERRILLEKIYTERLTGLPNRSKLFLDMQRLREPAVFIINIDSFKEYNEFYGDEIGDFIIREIAERLEVFRHAQAFPCRLYKLQADEYALLLEGEGVTLHPEEFMVGMIARLTDVPILYRGYEMPLTVTVGGVTGLHPDVSDDRRVRGPLSRADMALKRAKAAKKHYLLYDRSMDVSAEYAENIRWMKTLRRSVAAGGIVPYYQPIQCNKTGSVKKYEALVRLFDETGRLFYPSIFLGVAKRSKIYPQITRLMIEKTFATFAGSGMDLSINLSVEDIFNDATTAFIHEMLEVYGADLSGHLIFEIVESEGIENFALVQEFIRRVKAQGCRIAIDDFGTGYSNFNYIDQLNVDYIKIDASMIRNLDTDRNCRIITETIVNFAAKMGISTVAEFVHSQGVYDIVRELGIDFSQGYFIGQPMSSDAIFRGKE